MKFSNRSSVKIIGRRRRGAVGYAGLLLLFWFFWRLFCGQSRTATRLPLYFMLCLRVWIRFFSWVFWAFGRACGISIQRFCLLKSSCGGILLNHYDFEILILDQFFY